MDIFSQKKFLVRTVMVLIVLNLSLIVFFLWGRNGRGARPPRPGQQELSGILKKELNLTDKQTEDFKNIRTAFFEKEKLLTNLIRTKRDSMNMLMYSTKANDEQLKSLASGVSENEYKMEILRIEQAQQLRTVCTPEQLVKFEKLIKEIRDYLKPDDKGNK